MHRHQRGFTLIELLAAIAIAGLITAGITAAIMQILSINSGSSNHMVAVRQVQQAGKEVSKDALQSQNITCGGGSGFPLTFNWTDWEGALNHVTYVITADNELQRSHTIDDTPQGTAPPIVAQYIDPARTSCVFVGGVLTFNVTATVHGESETRVYEIQPRPD